MHRIWTHIFLAISFPSITLAGSTALAQSVSRTPTQAPNIQAPAPQRQQPTGGGHPPASSAATLKTAPAPLTTLHAPYTGTLEGYVYWNTTAVQHNPASACTGLSVTVSVGTPPNGTTPTFEQFTSIGTYNAFTYLNNGSSFGACAYAVKVPVGQDLQVNVGVVPASFSQAVAPVIPPTANDPNAPIKIISGKCNNLPPAVPSPSVLGSGWWTCGNYAYNVNFLLQAPGPNHLMSSGSGQGYLLGRSPGSQNSSSGGMLIPRGTSNTQSQGSSGQGNGANTRPGNPNQKSLTNSDVVKMVRNGVPESVILSSIQSSHKSFNLGADGCSELRKARVSAKVLAAMGDGGKNTCFAGSHPTVKLSPPKQSGTITNAKARAQQAAIITVLQKQRTAADAEAVQMNLGIRPAVTQLQPSQTMSARGSGAMTNSPGAVQPAALAGGNSPTGNSPSGISRYAVAPLFNTLAITCAHDPTMRALTISGGPSPVVFTPDPKYNFYTITGCSFGSPGTNSRVYIYYQGTFHENFQIQQWTDNWIKLSLDPNISGVDDQSNITLVIQREDGTQAAKNGYSFYAVRQTVLLSHIPQSYFGIDQLRPDNSLLSSWKPTYTSGSSASVTPNLSGLSAEVHWDISYDSNGGVVGGTDLYDFSHLHPTFALDSAAMAIVNVACTDPTYSQFVASTNNWSIDWYGPSGVQVGWQGQICQPTPGACGGFMQSDCFEGLPESNYGVNVWVSGPRGLDPWTGKPLG